MIVYSCIQYLKDSKNISENTVYYININAVLYLRNNY